MLTSRYFQLRSLGQLSLTAVAGETETAASVRPRHLAVLTVLALSPRPVSRDALLEMFWGGETEDRARHSLSNALSGLRSLLGADAITARRDHVALSAEARLEVDVLQFASACDVHDDARAASLYGGPLLAGVHVPDAPEFDAWVGRERARLERQFLELCERYVPVLMQGGQWKNATAIAERWVETAPRSTFAVTTLLRAHAGPGTPAALASALSAYDRIRALLADTYDVTVDASITALAATLRDQLSRTPSVIPSDPSVIPSLSVAAAPSRAGSARDLHLAPPVVVPATRRWSLLALAGAALAIVVGVWTVRRPVVAAETKLPIVAVTSIDDVRGDSSLDWLRAGLPRMIATDLGGIGGVEVVTPARVRDVVVRLAGSSTAQLTEDQAVDVARRVGASWAITGGISAARGGSYLLDVTVHSVRGTKPAESFTIMSSNPIELGQLAATRLASLLDAIPGNSAPRYSGIETSSPEAYRHFVRGMLAWEAEQAGPAAQEFDAAIALDSEFVQAIRMRQSVAIWLGDSITDRRLAPLEARHEDRLSELERFVDDLVNADSLGESSRAEALSKRLLQRFPHDPRAYSARADLLSYHGRWAEAESVLVRELALDSLAMVAGNGPCTPCEVLWRLSRMRLALGDRGGAEASARQWVALQPDLPAAWRNLSATLAAVGESSDAVEAGLHLVALSKDAPAVVDFGRTMLAARRFDIVDSLIAAWRKSSDPVLADGVLDLTLMLRRERGQFIASTDELPIAETNGLSLVRADGLARTGRLAAARAIFEFAGHPKGSSRSGQLSPPEARGFSWAHALEADALVRAGDTTAARALADSIARAGQQSYYGRDKLLHHHVLGMLYYVQGRWADAERELRAAEWAAGAWTRTNVELARAQLAQQHYADAISTLRDARLTALDAMGRYVPHSEIDWWLARAFAAAGQRDSAHVYADYVRRAWSRADPAVKSRLDSLPP